MRLIALCGAAGAGKDTVADMLPARKLAFADTLYAEVAAAWGVEQHVLRCRETKELSTELLAVDLCGDRGFREDFAKHWQALPRSPRQILQWWGDYRRAQDPDYFVDRARIAVELTLHREPVIVTDVRFHNESAMIRQLGGKIWQIKRQGYEAGGTGHASDNDGSQFNPDRIIYNNGTLLELRQTVTKEFDQ